MKERNEMSKASFVIGQTVTVIEDVVIGGYPPVVKAGEIATVIRISPFVIETESGTQSRVSSHMVKVV